MTTECLVLTRAVHFGACLLFFGLFAFDRFVAATILKKGETEVGGYWSSCLRFFNLLLLSVILLSGMAWFALIAMSMSGQPLQWVISKEVWTQTEFGTVWKIRLFLWLVSAGAGGNSSLLARSVNSFFFSDFLAAAMVLHKQQGCLPSNVSFSATFSGAFSE